jgi:predicted transcriptional regulator
MHRNCDAIDGEAVKSSTIPPLRVSAKLRKQAESVLREGETLSGFVLEALTRSVEARRAQEAFLARGLASAAQAKASGRYVPAGRVIGKLRRRLAAARRRHARG